MNIKRQLGLSLQKRYMEDPLTNILEALQHSWHAFLRAVPGIALAILLFVIGILIANWISSFSQRRLLKQSQDPLMVSFLSKAIRVVLIAVAFMLALYAAGLGPIAAGILATAGASAVILGFAFKDIGENFIAGIIMAFKRPFEVNDTVQIGQVMGKIKGMDFRHTKIKTFDGKDIYIPNSDVMTEPVTNYTEDGFFRWDFVAGIAYEDDIQAAKDVIMKTIAGIPEVVEDAEHENFVVEDELATSTVNLKTFFWVETTDFRRGALMIRGNVIRAVKEALENNGFSLPADIQEIKLYGGEKEFPIVLKEIREGRDV